MNTLSTQEHARHPFEIWLVLIVMGFACTWLMQDSINNYVQQKYHVQSPLAALKTNAIWNAGAETWDALLHSQEEMAALVPTGDAMAKEDDSASENDVAAARLEAITPEPASSNSEAFNIAEATPLPAQVLPQAAQPKAAPTRPVPVQVPAPINPAPLPAQPVSANPADLLSRPAPPAMAGSNVNGPYLQLNRKDRVLLAGDSLMQGIAPHIQRMLKNADEISSINLSKQSTGLTYPGFFNWPKTISKAISDDSGIRMVIIMLGPNDPWDMPDPGKRGAPYLRFKSPQWEAIYRQRITEIINEAAARNIKTYWVGAPVVKNTKLNNQLDWLTGVMESQVRSSGASWLDTREILGSIDGKYSESVVINGKQVKVRSADGVHYTVEGQRYLARKVVEQIQINANDVRQE